MKGEEEQSKHVRKRKGRDMGALIASKRKNPNA